MQKDTSGFKHHIFSFFHFQNIDLPGLAQFGQQDYHPYVFFKVNLNLLEK